MLLHAIWPSQADRALTAVGRALLDSSSLHPAGRLSSHHFDEAWAQAAGAAPELADVEPPQPSTAAAAVEEGPSSSSASTAESDDDDEDDSNSVGALAEAAEDSAMAGMVPHVAFGSHRRRRCTLGMLVSMHQVSATCMQSQLALQRQRSTAASSLLASSRPSRMSWSRCATASIAPPPSTASSAWCHPILTLWSLLPLFCAASTNHSCCTSCM